MQTVFSQEFLRTNSLVPNKVLIKPTYGQHTVNIGGVSVNIDYRFSHEKHAPVSGEVINCPQELNSELLPWGTANKIIPGDYAVYSYEAAMYALDPLHGMVFFDNEMNPYLMIDYEDIFVVRRGETIIPVNGYLLVSPIEQEINNKSNLIIPGWVKEKSDARIGTVEFIGAPNSHYKAPKGAIRTDTYDITEEILPGDIVVFSEHSDVPIEYDIHNTLGPRNYYRMQRRDILHIIKSCEFNKN